MTLIDAPDTKLALMLSFPQKISRAYGFWWDIINIGVAIFILAMGFIALSIMIIAGRMELLPLQDLIWQQFIDTVPPEKQSEIGLGMLSVSISASSAAALYLIRVGTIRWANNRRISYTYIFFADALMFRCDHAEPTSNSLQTVIRGFFGCISHTF